MSKKEIYSIFRETINNFDLLRPEEAILVGCSGGPDSVALLVLFKEFQKENKIDISVACLNHGLRAHAEEEVRFVKSISNRMGFKFYTKKTIVSKKDSLEQQARIERIRFFKEISQKTGIQKVALGHNSDDVAETVFMRILKGTGLRGLRAIMPKSEVEGLIFIRPLIFLSKEDILAFLKKKGVQYCVDESNYSYQFLRNKIRHFLIPLIEKECAPGFRQHLLNLYLESIYDYAFLEEEVNKIFARVCKVERNRIIVSSDKFKRLPMAAKALLFRSIYKVLNKNLKGLEYKHFKYFYSFIESLRYNKILELPRGINVLKTKDTLIFLKR